MRDALTKEIKRRVALAHIKGEIVDTDALAQQIQAQFPYTIFDELVDKIAMEVISRRAAAFLSPGEKDRAA